MPEVNVKIAARTAVLHLVHPAPSGIGHALSKMLKLVEASLPTVNASAEASFLG